MANAILSVGYDRKLLELRSLLLRQSLGIDVMEALDLPSALQIARSEQAFDMLLLCHSVPATDQRMLIEAVRGRSSDVSVLSVFPGLVAGGSLGTPVDNNPKHLIAAVSNVLAVRHKGLATAEQGL